MKAHERSGLDSARFEFAAYLDVLSGMDLDQMRALSEQLIGRRMPPKVARDRARAFHHLAYRWFSSDHERLQGSLYAVCDGLAAEHDLNEAEGRIPPHLLLFAADRAGLDADALLDSLPEDTLAIFDKLSASVLEAYAELSALREENLASGGEATRRAAQRTLDQLARGYKAMASRSEVKVARAKEAVARVVERERHTRAGLERDLAAERSRVSELAAANEALTAELAESQAEVRFLRRRLRRRLATVLGPQTAERPLVGHVVLAVGDEGHSGDSRRVVEDLGAEFAFADGFGNPAEVRSKARRATLIAFVTAYASHKVWNVAKDSGVPVVPVLVAGVESFRRALLEWLANQHPEPRADEIG